MNKILLNFLIKEFLKTLSYVILIFYSFGIILNLFEEIEFFKNLDVSFMLPLTLTGIFIPSMIIKILPFIIFISSMWFMVKIRNNRDLITLKVFGFSNFKIFFILASTSFILGLFVLIFVNPITSSMSKYYEKTKSNYSKDIDHLITFNKNGLWIREKLDAQQRIISADKPEEFNLININIFHLDEKSKLIEKINAKSANIKKNTWRLEDVIIYQPVNGMMSTKKIDYYEIESNYNYDSINSLFKNFNTMSFLNIITNYEKLLENGYSDKFLKEILHGMLSLPFFLFLMTALASIFTMNSLTKSDNLKLIIFGFITCVATFYFKDLSLALGKTERIPLYLAIWAPVFALSFFTLIGVLQINEK